ncbi:SPOR domain-containing protein [Chachezhania sediminis]|uniref:SPOR domain-containing protein n=1 Tax=Chachezhania sediminis TaxID=2599291 RepID=UPI001E40B0CF|nr:SPOR domain-containing protein [Chachezhania sediminis]
MAVYDSAAPGGPRISHRYARPTSAPVWKDGTPKTHAGHPQPSMRPYADQVPGYGHVSAPVFDPLTAGRDTTVAYHPAAAQHHQQAHEPYQDPYHEPAYQPAPAPRVQGGFRQDRDPYQAPYPHPYRDPYQQAGHGYQDPHGYAEPDEDYGYDAAYDDGYDHGYEDEEQDTAVVAAVPRLGAMANIAGAVLSVALLGGVAVWGYDVVTRDVSGIPVVQALEGPMREAPADPGGQPVDYQGLAVNAIAADGIAAPTADRLVLAPPPATLEEEDISAEQRTEQAVTDAAIDRAIADAARATTAVTTVPAMSGTSRAQADADGQVAAEGLPAVPQITVLPASVPGPSQSLRPRQRPAGMSQEASLTPVAVPTASDAVSAASNVRDVSAASLPSGTRLAQLGAFDSAQAARSEWDRLNGKFGDYLAGKGRVIQEASSGGRTFYRLRAAGFDDLSAARRFCSALVAEGAACIPVTVR